MSLEAPLISCSTAFSSKELFSALVSSDAMLVILLVVLGGMTPAKHNALIHN